VSSPESKVLKVGGAAIVFHHGSPLLGSEFGVIAEPFQHEGSEGGGFIPREEFPGGCRDRSGVEVHHWSLFEREIPALVACSMRERGVKTRPTDFKAEAIGEVFDGFSVFHFVAIVTAVVVVSSPAGGGFLSESTETGGVGARDTGFHTEAVEGDAVEESIADSGVQRFLGGCSHI
jgi:hypothetical protein